MMLYGFAAALVIIHILTAENIDKSLIVEEVTTVPLGLNYSSDQYNLKPSGH